MEFRAIHNEPAQASDNKKSSIRAVVRQKDAVANNITHVSTHNARTVNYNELMTAAVIRRTRQENGTKLPAWIHTERMKSNSHQAGMSYRY